MLPVFLEHLRVEERRAVGTLSRYESHLRRLLTAVGDRPVGEITGAQSFYFKRHLMDAGLSAPTMAAVPSCLRTFLKYLREVRGLPVYDPDRIHRPKNPKTTLHDEVSKLPPSQLPIYRPRG